MIFRKYGSHGYLSVPLFYVIGMFYTIIVMQISTWLQHTYLQSILSYVGQQSMRLLCIHFVIQGYSVAIINRIPFLAIQSEYLHAIIYIAEVMMFNYCIQLFLYKYKDKVKLMRYI